MEVKGQLVCGPSNSLASCEARQLLSAPPNCLFMKWAIEAHESVLSFGLKA